LNTEFSIEPTAQKVVYGNFRPETANDTFRMLQVNFQDQYDVNRAPFGIFTKSSWLQGPTPDFDERKQGYKMYDTLRKDYEFQTIDAR
jgi:hypothetical protein